MSDDDTLRQRAEDCGIETRWRDVAGQQRVVAPEVLRAVIAALGDTTPASHPPVITTDVGTPVRLRGQPGRWRLALEDGSVSEGWADDAGDGHVLLPRVDQDGYHRLSFNGRDTVLATAPQRCWTVMEATEGRRAWGLTVQLYSLRRQGDGGIGDFTGLRTLVEDAAAAGGAAVAISPVHAQFTGDAARFSPYAPSSRSMLNVLHADAEAGLLDHHAAADLAAGDLVDWPRAAPLRIAALTRMFAAMNDDERAAFARFRSAGGEALERHARFEALHAAQFAADPAHWNWRDWPSPYQDPAGPAVAAFAAEHADAVSLHAYLQFAADRGLQAAQTAARAAGMPIGLITDIAVGTDPGGSDAWCRPTEMLRGLTIGAPPDLFNPAGQNWGVTTFSPHGLIAGGFAAFLEMLRAALRHAGGLRVDHVMGLARLWVVPQGAVSGEGAYLRFPMRDMLRLVRMESRRHRAIVLGEDLGTLPDGFREQLQSSAVAGMRVLWFERDGDRFIPPWHWSPDAVAMTSTHDLPTVAGWWTGRDIEWRERLGHPAAPSDRPARAHDRALLWRSFQESGSASGEMAESGEAAADSAAAHIGTAACALALLPIEDALALPEQPNVPGTIDEHPNWRRRMPGEVEGMLKAPAVAARLQALAKHR
jgi:4-alpha-glucanotransferase